MVSKLKFLLLAGLFFIFVLPVEAVNNNINIIINGKNLIIPKGDQQALIVGDRTYVPLRIISEKLGAKVDWRADTRQVLITSSGQDSQVAAAQAPGDPKDVRIVIDGKVLNVPADYGLPFITEQDRLVVPLRAVGEGLGCEVNWLEESRTVEIKSMDQGAALEPVITTPEIRKLFQELALYKTNLLLQNRTIINSEELQDKEAADFSAEQLEQFKAYAKQLAKYKQEIEMPDETILNSADLTILGPSTASAEQLQAWVTAKVPEQSQMAAELAELYLKIGTEYGIRGDLAFCQAAKETNFWRFTGAVQPYQNNYCGLWATSTPCTGNEPYNGADPDKVHFEEGVYGVVFESPEVGVEAHIQHLYAYACKDPLPEGKVLYDPRFNLVSRGLALTWQGLNARWAVPGITYGQSIIQDYWLGALSCANNY